MKSVRRGYEHTFVYSGEVVKQTLMALEGGASVDELSRRTGVARTTIRRWRRDGPPSSWRDPPAEGSTLLNDQTVAAYSYLLGVYLGDGCLVERKRGVFVLEIALDSRYRGIVEEVAAAVSVVLPQNRVSVQRQAGANAVRVIAYSKLWPTLFPQHGSGPKHLRDIALQPWQREITTKYPRQLIRGLIHSDGSRFIAHQRVGARMYRYLRYEFVNHSKQIIDIFTDHLDMLDVVWTQPRWKSIQIARREAVAKLDEFVGPKT